GAWSERPDRGVIEVTNPSDGSVIAHVAEADVADADAAVAAARRAFDEGPWPRMSYDERAAVLNTIADRLDARGDELVHASIADLGIPRGFAEAINPLFSTILRDNAALAPELAERSHQERTGMGSRVVVLREPGGVAVCIVPWNAPVLLAATKAGAALMAGCTVVVKVDPNAPLGAIVLAEACADAGLPEGVISFLPGGREVGEHLVAHPDVDHVSFTGSSATGRAVMASAAANLTRVTLELGGKSAGIMLEDMDPAEALPTLFAGCLGMSGQICTLLSRIMVPAARYAEWERALGDFYAAQSLGDADLESTSQGPLVSQQQLERVAALVDGARAEGARIVTGGRRPDGLAGWFYEPTLIADTTPGMRIVKDEVFGPVTVLIPYDSVDEAIAMANASEYGLAGAIFTHDRDAAFAIGTRLRAGAISWNGFGCCPTQPFGGYKQSGMGREGGIEGVEAFLEVKQFANGVGVV
ncbi:MAG TPA: aldehyde dehydrogenase family protein, partial [Baekduia sp.]